MRLGAFYELQKHTFLFLWLLAHFGVTTFVEPVVQCMSDSPFFKSPIGRSVCTSEGQ